MLRTSLLALVGLITIKLVLGAFSLLWALVSLVVPVLIVGALVYGAYRLFSADTATTQV